MLPISALAPTLAQAGLPRLDQVAGDTLTLPRLGLPTDGNTLSTPGLRTPGANPATGESFGNVLGRLVNETNAKQLHAADTVRQLQAGGDVPLHQAVIAMEEANVSFQLMVEVRNKLLEAYQELMRMQL